ncbi:MAG: hypothetical protein U0936_27950 [Planctomycetaceae bacterium]
MIRQASYLSSVFQSLPFLRKSSKRRRASQGVTPSPAIVEHLETRALLTVSVTAPIGAIQDSTPTFQWTAEPGANQYQLLVRDNTVGSGSVINVMVPGTTYTPAANMNWVSYTTWVRPFNGTTALAAWSTPVVFNVFNSVTIDGAATGEITTSTTPTLGWSGQLPNEARYELQVDNLTTGITKVIHQTTLTTSTYTPTSPLTVGHQYRAWVRAFDPGNHASAWSAAKTFRVAQTEPVSAGSLQGRSTAVGNRFYGGGDTGTEWKGCHRRISE